MSGVPTRRVLASSQLDVCRSGTGDGHRRTGPGRAYRHVVADLSAFGLPALKAMDPNRLAELAADIRAFLVDKVCATGGHLGANLGVVELTIAVHRVFDSPRDIVLFDTGHQSYVHKILTGRGAGFDRLRQAGDLSGYPSRAESHHDWVENSHCSTALSYADGIATALSLRGELGGAGRQVVTVIGDGALTGGLAWEGLNNLAAAPDRPLVVVLNYNGRSYQPTVGGIAHHLGTACPSSCTPASPAPVPAALRIAVIEDRFTRQWHTYRWPLRQTTLRWAVQQRLLPADILHAYTRDLLHYTDLIAGYYVGAPVSVVQAIADFSVWFFIWDDWHGVAARHRKDQAWQRLNRALRRAVRRPADHRGHADPLVAAFADSVTRLSTGLGPAWNMRFAAHMDETFDAYDQEYRNLAAGTVPTVAEFLALRRCTFAHDVWLDLLELTAGQELAPAVRDHDIYRRAARASQEFASGYNDLCSMPKEMAAGDVHNLGICFMRHEGLDARQAQAKVRRYVADRVNRFLRAEAQVPALLNRDNWPSNVEDAVRSCVFNMRNWISSTYWFHHESGRYRMTDWPDPARPTYVREA